MGARPAYAPRRDGSAPPRVRAAIVLLVALGVVASLFAAPVSADPPPGAKGHRFLRDKTSSALAAAAPSPAAGFTDSVVTSGLVSPTAVRFASDGRVVVAEKSGRVLVYPGLESTTPIVALDISTAVHDYWDRGLLGLALDPGFSSNGRIYVMYAYNHILGSSAPAPRWDDACPSPPGPTTDGCVISGRLSRFTLTGNVAGPEQVLIEDWCQQFPSHSVADLAFGPDGFLYASAGDGGSFNTADWGQLGGSAGSPIGANPCGDPPGGSGVANTSPSGRGGALRSQSLRRPTGEPVVLNGSIIRVDPATGAAAPSNPGAGSSNANTRRIVAHGFRNPFRMAFRPGTGELWIGDVGWSTREEIDRLVSPASAPVENFGWPCYEGAPEQAGYAPLTLCQGLYSAGTSVAPLFTYSHTGAVVGGDSCPTSTGSAITGMAFYQGGSYPSKYSNALFFADHSRNCIWALLATNGIPDATKRERLVGSAANPVDLQIGPAGDMFYVDHEGGAVHRLTYAGGNTPPVASFSVTPSSGIAPLAVTLDGRASSDPDQGDSITYAWDFTNNGSTDATTPTATFTYANPSVYTARLTVTDPHGASTSTTRTVTANNTAPEVSFSGPASSGGWSVGSSIPFSGLATDAQDGTLPASALTWTFTVHHCTTPTACHSHLIETRSGVASGTFSGPDHAYPAHLEIGLRATDSGGLSTTRSLNLDPATVDVAFATSPTELGIVLNGTTVRGTLAAPTITRTVIVNSQNTLTATTPQVLNLIERRFSRWSDTSTAATRTIRAPATPWASPLTAIFNPSSADLAVVQSGVRNSSGTSVSWTVTAKNRAGGLAASSIRVQVAISTYLKPPVFNAPGWTCSYTSTTRLATCLRSSLAAGASADVRFTTAVATAVTTVTNVATISSATRDVSTSNNRYTTSVRLR